MSVRGSDHGRWRETLRRALDGDDLALLATVPKADLHCHGLLSAPRQAYEELLGHPLPPPPVRFADFSAFGGYIVGNLLPALTSITSARHIVRAAFERAAAENVVYAEMSFDAFAPELVGATIETFAEMLAGERDRVADRMRIALEIGISRALPPEEVRTRFERWLATGVCRSIDLYDDENLGTLSDFAPLFRLARERGLKLKAHAGELRGPEAVRDSVEILDLDAVQHGVRAAESAEVTAFLAARGIVLNVCPTSNRALGVCPSLDIHPAKRLFDGGVKVTVNSDDFTLFGASVSQEILNLKRMGFSTGDIEQIVANGLAGDLGTARTAGAI